MVQSLLKVKVSKLEINLLKIKKKKNIYNFLGDTDNKWYQGNANICNYFF